MLNNAIEASNWLAEPIKTVEGDSENDCQQNEHERRAGCSRNGGKSFGHDNCEGRNYQSECKPGKQQKQYAATVANMLFDDFAYRAAIIAHRHEQGGKIVHGAAPAIEAK